MSSKITASKTALVLLDFQNIHAGRVQESAALLSRASSVAATARKHGMLVVHVRVAFTAEEAANLPPCFERLKANPDYLANYLTDAAPSQFHPDVAPREGDIVVIKKRVGPFRNASLDLNSALKQRSIDTLVLGGIATGGAVLSTAVEAGDLDYKLFVLEDACADPDPETHQFLIEYLKKRGDVIKCSEFDLRVASGG